MKLMPDHDAYPESNVGSVVCLEETNVNHRDREALGPLDPRTGEGVGVVRYVRLLDDPEEAEFAIAIVDDWQGRGLGRVLLALSLIHISEPTRPY